MQADEPNHYPGPVPVEDVRRRLFPWHAVEGVITATALSADGVLTTTDPERKAIMRDDSGAILGIFKSGYLPHQYDEWLLDTVANILDDKLNIGSAGLLKGGGVAWVSVEVPDNIVTPSGFAFRPNLLAATSLDGSLSTTYKPVCTAVVCDNTMSAALSEHGARFKVKHSRYSHAKLNDVRDALGIVHQIGDAFSAHVEELTNTTVTDAQFSRFLESLSPVHETDGTMKQGRGLTVARNKQTAIQGLWEHDSRVKPWSGTAFGVVQAVNTWEHHLKSPSKSGVERGEANMLRAVTGGVDKLDSETLTMLRKVLVPA